MSITPHRLRRYVSQFSKDISNSELDEIESKIDFDDYMDYECSGNFIFTKGFLDRERAIKNMCCGILSKDIELSNGEIIYFAFDYGH